LDEDDEVSDLPLHAYARRDMGLVAAIVLQAECCWCLINQEWRMWAVDHGIE
jgi:hypothetical protein